MYEKAFYITGPISNNAFNYHKRINKKIYVPALIEGDVKDVKIGTEVVFEDFDEGILRSCVGLKDFVLIRELDVPIYVFDNHNHAFAFWYKEKLAGKLGNGAILVHIDGHKDNRIPERFLAPSEVDNIDKIFKYTNTVLNVGNFIPPAQKTGLIKDVLFITSQAELDSFNLRELPETKRIFAESGLILDIDLDFFVPELDYINNQNKIALIKALLPLAKVVTIATSPFFIEQDLAIKYLRRIITLK